MLANKLNHLVDSVYKELTTNILPYWINNMIDEENGGFYGSRDFYNNLQPAASKGAVLNTRILWTFSRAYNELKDIKYLHVANRAYEYIEKHFRDPIYDGIFWELDFKGNAVNTQKYCYTQGFWIYSLVEYYRATQQNEVLETALNIFSILEEKASDKEKNGYVEAFTRDWSKTQNVRISDKDLNENKTFNTHLHIIEPYTQLYQVSKNRNVATAIEKLCKLMFEKFYNEKNGHFNLFFDDNWNVKGDLISYGHDIEASWLLWEALTILNNENLIKKYKNTILNIVEVTAKESIDVDGGQFYEGNMNGLKDTDKHWWPQAETVIGFINAFQITQNEKYLDWAIKTWNFIDNYIIDKERGEWYWRVNKYGQPYTNDVKAGFWKCPYHNSRLCFELMNRFKFLIE